MAHICEFCNKGYTSLSSLNYHKRSTKFCIEIQKKNSTIPISNINEFNCEFCEKNFTTKLSLATHLIACDVKKYKDKIDKQYSLFKEEVESKYKDYENQLSEYKIKLESKDEQLKSKDEQLKSKDEQIKKLEEKVERYESQLFDNNNKLTEQLINRPQIVNNNTNNNNYTIEFNKLKNELLPFTDANIKNCINSIDGNNLIFFNDYDINSNFIHNFVNAIKVMTFCTDASRGSMIVIDENKKHKKMVATQFILECFEKSTPECIAVINKAMAYVKAEHESEDSVVSTEDYGNCIHALFQIREHLKLNKPPADLVKLLSSNLTKNVKQCSKNTSNFMIEN